MGAGLAVAAVVGYLLGVKPGEAARHVAGVSPWAIAGCVASSFVVLALQSARWHAVMAPLLRLRYADAFRAQVIGLMFNAVLPARGGDLLRVQYLGRRTGLSRSTILGTEIVDRWLDWWGWIPTFAVLCLATAPPRWLFKALGIFVGALTVWALAMVVLTRRGYRPRPGSRLGRIVASMQAGVSCFRARRTWMIAFLIAPLPWLWETIAIAVGARAFGIDVSMVTAFSVLIGFNLAMVVPSPGSIGTVEVGGTAALVFAGVDQSRALAFMFVYHFTQLLPGIATGVALLVAEGERLFGPRAERGLEAVAVEAPTAEP